MNKLPIILLTIVLITIMAGYSSDTPINPYIGRDLKIGVIGGHPDIIESNKVTFSSIEFEDLTNEDYKRYDAVFIMKERLEEAATDHDSEVYLQVVIPIIFIGTDTLTPFLTNDVKYQPKAFQKGSSYSVGIINGKKYGLGLYNDKENEDSLHLFYSDLFRLIEKSY
ncbi:hypothetical protein ACLM5H_03105 [Fredinandcohnia humi]